MLFPGPNEHETVQQLFTSSEPKIVQRAAAAEAALNVCETFAAAAVLLVFISMVHGHLKRMLAVLVVGLLAFSTDTMVFIQTRGSGVSASNLSRPFLFNFFEAMVSILAFLIIWILVFSVSIVWFPNRTIDQPEEQIHMELANARREFDNRTLGGRAVDRGDEEIWQDYLRERSYREANQMRSLTYLSVLFLPVSLGASLLGGYGTFGPTEFMSSLRWTARLPFFVPKSATGITELDQLVSLCIGFTALLFNLWQALKSHRRKERTQQRTWRQQGLTRAIRLLLQVNEKLDQIQNETERQTLLDRRNMLMAEMSRMA